MVRIDLENSVKIFFVHIWTQLFEIDSSLSKKIGVYQNKTMLFCTELQKRAKRIIYYGDSSNGIAKACSPKLATSFLKSNFVW